MQVNAGDQILLTGAGGYIGSILTSMLLERGYHVTAFDYFYFGVHTLSHAEKHPNLRIVQGDIRSLDSSLLHNIKAVIHLAGLSSDAVCELDPLTTISVNRDAIIRLAQLAKEQGVERFLFASSCSVYGSAGEKPLDEESQLRPLSLYARLKEQVEKLLIRMTDDSFHPVSLRIATLYGISHRMRFDLVLNSMTLHAAIEGHIHVDGGGQQWRPFLHVYDAARAFFLCLETPLENISGQVFNVVSRNYQIVELARLISGQLRNTSILVRPGTTDPRDYQVSGQRLASTIGFSPTLNIEVGIHEIVEAIQSGNLDDLDGARYGTMSVYKRVLVTPANKSGMPFRSAFLPFATPLIGKAEEEEVIDTLRSGWLTTGPKTQRFEGMLREYIGSRHVVALNSCTGALHLAIAACGIVPGDEVITTPITWPATANVVALQGAKPVFVDIEPDTLNIDITKIEGAITSRTRAILPVHIAGQPCDMGAIHEVAHRHNLIVVEDAAQALGAEYNGTRIGVISKATAFSFYPTKNITTIEGGALATDDDEFAEKVRILSLHGISKDAWKRYSPSGALHWQLLYPGFKYNMTDVQASLGLHQLPRLDEFIEIRAFYANLYDEAFADLPAIRPLSRRANVRHTHHLYIILLQLEHLTITRDQFALELKAENVGTGIHFISLHLQPYYRDTYRLQAEDFPVADWASHRLLSLPLYPKLTKQDIEDVIRAVFKITRAYRRA